MITEDEELFCMVCRLIVADQWVRLSRTLNDLGMVGDADHSLWFVYFRIEFERDFPEHDFLRDFISLGQSPDDIKVRSGCLN